MTRQELNELLKTMTPQRRLDCLRQLGPETAEKVATVRRAKYGNTRTVVDGVRFDSKKEAAVFERLRAEMAEPVGNPDDAAWFCLQPQFVLPGGVIYRADFLVVTRAGRVRVIDVKGYKKDKVYRLKKRQVESLYGIEIEEL